MYLQWKSVLFQPHKHKWLKVNVKYLFSFLSKHSLQMFCVEANQRFRYCPQSRGLKYYWNSNDTQKNDDVFYISDIYFQLYNGLHWIPNLIELCFQLIAAKLLLQTFEHENIESYRHVHKWADRGTRNVALLHLESKEKRSVKKFPMHLCKCIPKLNIKDS